MIQDNYAKIIDVVAAIIERDGKILLAQRPPHADQLGCGSSPAAKSNMAKASRRR